MRITLNIQVCIITTIIFILVRKSEAQRSGIGLIQTTLESALAKGDAIANSANIYLKSFTQSNLAELADSSEDNGTRNIASNKDAGILPKVLGTFTQSDTAQSIVLFRESNNNASSFGRLPTPDSVVEHYLDRALQPVQKSGAGIVEGAVKTGVDQAFQTLTDNFKIDIYLVVAVLIIQLVLFVCGAHLCFYVYQRERDMRSYVKQQLNQSKAV